MKKHCMVDIETLGTLPGSVIVSIGAVTFGQGQVYDKFYTNVSIQSCLDRGLTVDGGALKFWLTGTNDQNRKDLFDQPRGLMEALQSFSNFYRATESDWLWCHGANFDVPLLDYAYDICGYGSYRPWAFRHLRDTRTLYSLIGKDFLSWAPPRSENEKHNALADADYQACCVMEAYSILGKEMEQ